MAALASGGVAVVIDREAMQMVSAGGHGCAAENVSFVSREGRVHAICNTPPSPYADAVIVEAPPPAPPTWSVEEGASIRETLDAWIPSGWTLAWDTASEPVAAASFAHQGEPMGAIAELFDRRSVWADTPLIACAFAKQQILQVRESGACGSP